MMGCHLSMSIMGFQVNMKYDGLSRVHLNMTGFQDLICFCQHEYDGFSVHMNTMAIKSA